MIDIKLLKKLKNIKVLVVEDDELTAKMIEQSLSLYCKSVYLAYNGISGYELFEKYKPDVIITDINLPEMNGHEMIRFIHNISPSIPVIVMTSYDNYANILESINQRAYSYLRKPFQIDDLQISLLMATKDIYNFRIILENNFIYCSDKKALYQNEKMINLTRTENKLINLLMSNINCVVEYSIIENYVWEEKIMTSEALRMCIKKIRNKTYSNIIENIQGCGYKISSKII